MRVLTQHSAGDRFGQEVMESPLDVDSVHSPYMGLSDKRGSKADSPVPGQSEGERLVRKNILIKKRRRLQENNVAGRYSGEEMRVDGVEEMFSVGERSWWSVFCRS